MAHNIDSMMYYGETPWHGLGTKLDSPATAVEAIQSAGLDWDAVKVPVYAKHQRGETLVPDKYAMMRSDRMVGADAIILGVVGSQYTPIQNRDAFRFFDPIVGEGAAIYHTAGSLGKGEQIWILAKLPGEIRVVGDDIADKYLLLYNSHDGSGAAQVKFTPIRVVCQNTLNMALQGDILLKIAHTRNMVERIDEVHKAIEFVNTSYDRLGKEFQQLAKVQINGERLKAYVEEVLPLPKDNETRRRKLIQQRREVVALFESGRGNNVPGAKGTLWAAYNGFTEYADYRLVSGTRTQSGRVNRIWFGDAANLKVRAYETAIKLAKSWA